MRDALRLSRSLSPSSDLPQSLAPDVLRVVVDVARGALDDFALEEDPANGADGGKAALARGRSSARRSQRAGTGRDRSTAMARPALRDDSPAEVSVISGFGTLGQTIFDVGVCGLPFEDY